MALNNIDTKDPDEVKDYGINWSRELAQYSDTIQSSSWPNPPTGITIVTDTFDDTSTTVWLSGGTLGTDYPLTNRIVTTSTPESRILDQTIIIRVRAR